MRIVICGAGVIGAATAHRLAARGADVTLVERARPACAASGKSAGFVARDWCDGTAQGPLARLSFELHGELAGDVGERFPYGFGPVDTLSVASSERRSLPSSAGDDATGWLADDCVRGDWIGDTTSSAQLHPRRFTEALVATACADGATIRTGTVEGLVTSSDGSAARGVLVDGEPLECDAVVVAMGPWSALLGEPLGLPPIGGLKGYSVTLRPAPERRARLPAQALFADYEMQDGLRIGPELVVRDDGEVYVCGLSGDEALPIDPDDVSVDADRCDALARIAARLSPSLSGAQLTARQACYRPVCADAMPLIGPAPSLDNAFVATAHNCWGMLNAPGTGLAMSELLLDGAAHCVDLAPLSPGRASARQ